MARSCLARAEATVVAARRFQRFGWAWLIVCWRWCRQSAIHVSILKQRFVQLWHVIGYVVLVERWYNFTSPAGSQRATASQVNIAQVERFRFLVEWVLSVEYGIDRTAAREYWIVWVAEVFLRFVTVICLPVETIRFRWRCGSWYWEIDRVRLGAGKNLYCLAWVSVVRVLRMNWRWSSTVSMRIVR